MKETRKMGSPSRKERGALGSRWDLPFRCAAAWSFVVLTFSFANSSNEVTFDAHPTESLRFSKDWLDQFLSEETRCTEALNAYQWRAVGLGSNMNSLLASWGKAIGMDSRRGVAVVLPPAALPYLECSNESSGQATRGWSCLFGKVPHLCTFSGLDEWTESIMQTIDTEEQYEEAVMQSKSSWTQKNRKDIEDSLESPSTDARGVLAVLITLLFKSQQPWVAADIESILSRPSVSALRETPYIALHIRRSDKTAQFPAFFHDVEEYLREASNTVQALNHDVSAVSGIWISSDDAQVLSTVRHEAPKYFPGINQDLILSISFEPVEGEKVITRTRHMTYPTIVGLLAEMQMLAEAKVFVGTFSSNLGKTLALLRDGMGHERSTTVSLDRLWRLGSN